MYIRLITKQNIYLSGLKFLGAPRNIILSFLGYCNIKAINIMSTTNEENHLRLRQQQEPLESPS